MLVTFIFTLLFILVSMGILLSVKTPIYRLEACNVISLLELVVTGEATDSDWCVFTAVPISNDPKLEVIRQQCIDIEEREYSGDVNAPYLFTKAGLHELKDLLYDLQRESNRAKT